MILPLAATAAARGPAAVTVRSGTFATITGTLVAIITSPGPLIHDALVGRGTWVAAQVTHHLGNGNGNGNEGTGTPPDLSPALRMLQQIAFGIPLYVGLAWLTLWAIRVTARLSRS